MFQFKCGKCSQSFTAVHHYLAKKECLECPNCGNPVSSELLAVLKALSQHAAKTDVNGGYPEGYWEITFNGKVI